MSAISIDSIGPKHGSVVSIANAQMSMNATHGTFNFTIKNTSDATITASCGFYVTLASPHAFLEIEACGGVHGNGAVITMTPALPAQVRPLVDTYIPVRTLNSAVYQWGYAKIATTGVVTIAATVIGGVFTADTAMLFEDVSGKWSVAAF
jgi:hypothetical protein